MPKDTTPRFVLRSFPLDGETPGRPPNHMLSLCTCCVVCLEKSSSPCHLGDPPFQKHSNLTSSIKFSCTPPTPRCTPSGCLWRRPYIVGLSAHVYLPVLQVWAYMSLFCDMGRVCVCVWFLFTCLKSQRWKWNFDTKIMEYKCNLSSLYLHLNDEEL